MRASLTTKITSEVTLELLVLKLGLERVYYGKVIHKRFTIDFVWNYYGDMLPTIKSRVYNRQENEFVKGLTEHYRKYLEGEE